MATYDLEEQEQLDALKAWWKQYGNLITGVLAAVSVAAAGWQGWNWYQRNQAAQASVIYGVVQDAAQKRDAQRVKAATGELLEKFPGSTYAPMAAMLAGKMAFEAADAKTAKLQFAWAAEKANGEYADLARLRLAAVLLDEKAFDEALKQVANAASTAFAPRFADMQGDILLAQGKRAEARKAYETALQKNDADAGAAPAGKDGKAEPKATPFRELVQQKLDTLGDA